jgi:hypothetical protein
MRRCLLFALATVLLLAQADVTEGLVARHPDGLPRDLHHHGRHHHHQRVADKAVPGSGYRLLSLFTAAMHYKNYTFASSLLYDGGRFLITDISCGDMDKTAFMTLATMDNVASSQVILGEWTETAAGFTIVQAEVGALFGPIGSLANQSYYNPSVYYLVTPTLDGSQIASLQRWTDGTYRQANASLMINTFNTIVAASTLGDIKAWKGLLTDDFVFSMFFPFDEHLPFSADATVFIDTLFHEYQNQQSCIIKVRSVFPVCDFVGAEVMIFVQRKVGPPTVHKFFLSLRLDWLMRISLMQQFGLGYM